MHGIVHDFVVLNTVKNGNRYPTGNGGDAWADELLPKFPILKKQPIFKKVLDIGSLDINGNMRDYNFVGTGPKWADLIGMQEYTGIDLIEGPNVNKVANAHSLTDFRPSCFDLVLCLSVIEHDTDPAATIKEAYRVLKRGKPFILTTVSAEHEEHKHLGGGDTQTYNHLTIEQVLGWLRACKFKSIGYRNPETELLFCCIK